MQTQNKATFHPVIVAGVSGATWAAIKPLAAAGRLPNISRLCAEGSSGTLRSVRLSSDKHFRPQVAWPTLASGLHPDKHGVKRFYDTAQDIKASMLWDVYQQHGKRIGLFGWPITWPPTPVDGFVIPSHLARDAQTWPPELAPIKQLDRQQQGSEREGTSSAATPLDRIRLVQFLLRHGLGPRGMMRLGHSLARLLFSRDPEIRSLVLRHAKLDLSIDLFLSLSRRYQPGLSAFTTFLVDLVSHRYWRYHQPELFSEALSGSTQRLRTAVADAYSHVDHALGRIMANTPQDAIIALVSEHGMQAETEPGEIGPWRYVIRGEQLRSFVGLGPEIQVCPVARWLALRFRPQDGLQEEVARRMRGVIVSETGLPLFNVHLHGEDEVIVKFNIDRETESHAQGNLESLTIKFGDDITPFSAITRRLGRQRSAMHDGEGILAIRGPGITRGGRLPDATLMDFAPTLLHASGLPVPTSLDGRVLDIFSRRKNGLAQDSESSR